MSETAAAAGLRAIEKKLGLFTQNFEKFFTPTRLLAAGAVIGAAEGVASLIAGNPHQAAVDFSMAAGCAVGGVSNALGEKYDAAHAAAPVRAQRPRRAKPVSRLALNYHL